MIYIKNLLNKIEWDKREKPEDYELYFLDRIEDKYIKLKYKDIKRLEGSFMVIDKDAEEVSIPLHRIKFVKKKGKIIWQR